MMPLAVLHKIHMTPCKILVASAKSFEEFVDEQLQEDGSGQVLRREGGTGLLVPRGKQLSQAFIVAPGCCLCWEFRVKVRSKVAATPRFSKLCALSSCCKVP